MDRFCAFLGTVAGDLALTSGALGGVYIAGGIVPRFGKHFAKSPFRRRFEAKGRFKSYLRNIPVHVVTADQPALNGLSRLLRQTGVANLQLSDLIPLPHSLVISDLSRGSPDSELQSDEDPRPWA